METPRKSPPVFNFANDLKRACRYCATISRANLDEFITRGFVPRHTDATATVTFIQFDNRTYAVTAHHVIETFRRQAAMQSVEQELYYLPANNGTVLHPPFIRPPGDLHRPEPDVCLLPVKNDVPGRESEKPANPKIKVHAFDSRPNLSDPDGNIRNEK